MLNLNQWRRNQFQLILQDYKICIQYLTTVFTNHENIPVNQCFFPGFHIFKKTSMNIKCQVPIFNTTHLN